MDWDLTMQNWSFNPGEINPLGIARWNVSDILFQVQIDDLRASVFSFAIQFINPFLNQSCPGHFQLQKYLVCIFFFFFCRFYPIVRKKTCTFLYILKLFSRKRNQSNVCSLFHVHFLVLFQSLLRSIPENNKLFIDVSIYQWFLR